MIIPVISQSYYKSHNMKASIPHTLCIKEPLEFVPTDRVISRIPNCINLIDMTIDTIHVL